MPRTALLDDGYALAHDGSNIKRLLLILQFPTSNARHLQEFVDEPGHVLNLLLHSGKQRQRLVYALFVEESAEEFGEPLQRRDRGFQFMAGDTDDVVFLLFQLFFLVFALRNIHHNSCQRTWPPIGIIEDLSSHMNPGLAGIGSPNSALKTQLPGAIGFLKMFLPAPPAFTGHIL